MSVKRQHPSSGGADLAARHMVVMSLTIAVLAGGLALVLGGSAFVGEASAWLSERVLSAGAQAQPGRPALPVTEPVLPGRLEGRWLRGSDGAHLIVTARGEVWSDVGSLQGTAEASRAGANFTFGDGRYFCAYQVTFASDTTATWALVAQSGQTACPAGVFRKPADL